MNLNSTKEIIKTVVFTVSGCTKLLLEKERPQTKEIIQPQTPFVLYCILAQGLKLFFLITSEIQVLAFMKRSQGTKKFEQVKWREF